MNKAIVSLLLLSAVCASPASANYFSNPALGINLNIGSAPNPTPSDLRALGEARVTESTTVYAPMVAEAPPPAPAPEPAPYVEPAAPPPPAAQPSARATVRNFMVFFDFDRSNLTPEAREIVARAVDTAKQTGSARITVTGHTDTVGSRRYNQALSERRARSVKAEMVRLGMNSSEIVTMGKNFSEPLVATGPGVREPQNRRAVIDLGSGAVASNE